MTKYLPTNDLLFKKMLTSEDTRHILRAFVRDLLGVTFKTLTPTETYHIDSYAKTAGEAELLRTEVDILAVAENGAKTTIEMQIQLHHYFKERSVYYLVEAFCGSFANAETENFVNNNNFSALRATYGINIVNFHILGKNEKAVKIFGLLDEETHDVLKSETGEDILRLCYFSLVNENVVALSAVAHWQKFLKTGEVDESAPDYIKAAKVKTDFHSLKEEEQEMVLQLEKNKVLYDVELSSAKLEGRLEGEKLGVTKGKAEMAINMLKDNVDMAVISKYSQLPIEIIQKLREEVPKNN
ncbi:hypothetical protein Hs30E_05860 [Lactococcus hodotermopsidis]|uniref:Transposase n=1 Tax=Pseudolactococcus hodotermopsidis TaxID=2709157 RepID=A0A6A0BBJ8_9LACT|nr:Rpn family recombination-promoting nuclease/putative transposase [Lactococcus hodotermopsidis]GFH42035.1 hypothetical protein Hs30E_05860 [Lactococcus hodotermopsidis]